MTNEEFVQLAQKNNAILTPEQDEQSRRETLEFFERYELHRSWDGIYYVVDTHNPIYQLNRLVWKGLIFLIIAAMILIPAFLGVFLVVDAWKNPTSWIPVLILLTFLIVWDIRRKRKK
ncbi:MAG: hypothetical protein LBT05_14625 [Planctomycetaceae bacterium]|jgi:hypothetical protein|nr:hypothetical protein [Planctomycetaceae bacterium]